MVHLDTLPEDAVAAAFLRRLGFNVNTLDHRERIKELLVLMADAMDIINPPLPQDQDARQLAIQLRGMTERI
jgi:hypothetical protein